jgi:hypothetical protein
MPTVMFKHVNVHNGKKFSPFFTETTVNVQMLFRETMAAVCQNHPGHKTTKFGKTQILNITAGSIPNKHQEFSVQHSLLVFTVSSRIFTHCLYWFQQMHYINSNTGQVFELK